VDGELSISDDGWRSRGGGAPIAETGATGDAGDGGTAALPACSDAAVEEARDTAAG
jgi:hypothetical protein